MNKSIFMILILLLISCSAEEGVFFEKLTVVSLAKAIKQFNRLTINPKDCINQAKKFSKKRFKKEMLKFAEKHA